MSKLIKPVASSSPLNEDLIARIDEVAEKQMSINRKMHVKGITQTIFHHIMYFNSLEEDTMNIDNRPIESWIVLNEFKDFVLPNSIRFENGNRLFEDLLSRASSDFIPNYNDYHDALKEFRNWYKKDANDNIVKLSDLRVNKSLSEVWPIIADANGKVRYLDNSFVPIIINQLNVGQKDYYYNNDISIILDDYIKDIKLK